MSILDPPDSDDSSPDFSKPIPPPDPEALKRFKEGKQLEEREEREKQEADARRRADARNHAAMEEQRRAGPHPDTIRRVEEARARAAKGKAEADDKQPAPKRRRRVTPAAPALPTERELLAAMEQAETADDICAALSQWCRRGECRPDQIASMERLVAALETETIKKQDLEFSSPLQKGYWTMLGSSPVAVVDLPEADKRQWLLASLKLQREHLPFLLEAMNQPGHIMLSVEVMHTWWLSLKQHADEPDLPHPLAPVVVAWQRNQAVEREPRRRGILPDSWRHATYYDHLPLQAEPNPAPPGMMVGDQHLLPLAELQPQPSVIVPVLPLALYDSGTGPMATRGRGAPYAQRLFVEILLDVGRLDRTPGQTARVDVPLGDLVAWLWPRGWKRSRKGNRPGDLQILQRALLELDGLRILWDRMLWRLVAVQALPGETSHLDDEIVFRVEHLPGSEHGPMVDRNRLRRFGTVSAPTWRAYLRLAYLWDAAKAKNNGARIYATRPMVARVAGPSSPLVGSNGKVLRDRRGAVVTDWSDRRAVILGANGKPTSEDNPPSYQRNPAADRVAVLGPDDLVRLAFDDADVNPGTFRKRLHDARQALATMAASDAVVLESDAHGGLRVLETRGNAEGDTR